MLRSLQSWHQFHQFLLTTPAPPTLLLCVGQLCLGRTPTRPQRWMKMAWSWCAPARAPAVRSPGWAVARATKCMWHLCQRTAKTCWMPRWPLFRPVRQSYHTEENMDYLIVRYEHLYTHIQLSTVSFDQVCSIECDQQITTHLRQCCYSLFI